jgi:hypothetical protein
MDDHRANDGGGAAIVTLAVLVGLLLLAGGVASIFVVEWILSY